MSWENEADAQRHIPILTEDEAVIWAGLGSMTAWLARERETCCALCGSDDVDEIETWAGMRTLDRRCENCGNLWNSKSVFSHPPAERVLSRDGVEIPPQGP